VSRLRENLTSGSEGEGLETGDSAPRQPFTRQVNHRDEKSLLGVGQAQVRSPLSIPRHPAFAVASYSMLCLAALQTFGTNRTDQFCPLPKWRKKSSHYSTLDLLTLLRKEINNETSVLDYVNANMAQNLVQYAYT